MDNGKLVLIPVRTTVTVTAETPVGSVTFETAIVDRTGGRNRSLLLASPPPRGRKKSAGSERSPLLRWEAVKVASARPLWW